eukprot:1194633-Prorocentrum_minimum.AAC.6
MGGPLVNSAEAPAPPPGAPSCPPRSWPPAMSSLKGASSACTRRSWSSRVCAATREPPRKRTPSGPEARGEAREAEETRRTIGGEKRTVCTTRSGEGGMLRLCTGSGTERKALKSGATAQSVVRAGQRGGGAEARTRTSIMNEARLPATQVRRPGPYSWLAARLVDCNLASTRKGLPGACFPSMVTATMCTPTSGQYSSAWRRASTPPPVVRHQLRNCKGYCRGHGRGYARGHSRGYSRGYK